MMERIFTTWSRLRQSPRLVMSDFYLTPGLLVLWGLAVYLRPVFIRLDCARQPETCVTSNFFAIDRFFFGSRDLMASFQSDITQNAAGVLALAVPVLMTLFYGFSKRMRWGKAAGQWLTDWTLLIQTAALNGTVMEIVRFIVQRPRPYIYGNPAGATSPSNYTSFYSGHTSFAALSMCFLFLTVCGRGAPGWVLGMVALVGFVITGLTGILRVYSGNHFFTDVVVGAFMGALIAFGVAMTHRSRSGA